MSSAGRLAGAKRPVPARSAGWTDDRTTTIYSMPEGAIYLRRSAHDGSVLADPLESKKVYKKEVLHTLIISKLLIIAKL